MKEPDSLASVSTLVVRRVRIALEDKSLERLTVGMVRKEPAVKIAKKTTERYQNTQATPRKTTLEGWQKKE
jgi:hypothetical protein